MPPAAELPQERSRYGEPDMVKAHNDPVQMDADDLIENRKRVIRQTWDRIEKGLGVRATEIFYERLFLNNPEMQAMFQYTSMEMQAEKLYMFVRVSVRFLDHFSELVPFLRDQGERHMRYGVNREHYDAVVGQFVDLITSDSVQELYADTGILPMDVEEAWTWVLSAMVNTMADAGDEENGG